MRILTGRKKVVIPISRDDFYEDVIGNLKKYLGKALLIHNKNVDECRYLHNQYLGDQDILHEKTRYDSSQINNIDVENHHFKQVNFKMGFMYGNPLEYTIINEDKINSDDMTYLNAYLIDSNKSSLDIEKAQDLYEYGIAYQRLIPKRKPIQDVKSEAPFELANMPIENTCIVYSNDIPNEELFGLVLSEKLDKGSKRAKTIYQIFMPNRKIELDSKYNVITDKPQPYNYIPIKEFCLNKDRIGIIEVVLYKGNIINKTNSSQMDDFEENVNSFMAIFNQKLDDDFVAKFKELKKEKVVVLNSNNPQTPADIKMLSSDLDQDSSNSFYERNVKAMYDIVAVPQASGNVTSGGDTGQARLLGNGWESAQNQGTVDQNSLLQYERELLKNIIWICKNTADCPLNEINASDVAIKFNINMSNNLLIKAESLKMLDEINFPEKTNLTICGITKDVDGVGKAWKENKENKRKQELELENSKNNQVITNNENVEKQE